MAFGYTVAAGAQHTLALTNSEKRRMTRIGNRFSIRTVDSSLSSILLSLCDPALLVDVGLVY